jgi:UDP-N-acetylmuramoylalanine--D-glutamate ligase
VNLFDMAENWKGKNVVILGLGQYPKGSGFAAVEFFARAGANVVVSDFYYTPAMKVNADRAKAFKNVHCIFKKHPTKEIRSADLVIRHQRLRITEPEMILATELGKRIETAESMFLKLCPCPAIGITGTRGKSTTTTLVYEMLKASKKQVWLGGNILVSPLTFLSKIKKDHLVVLELSSFQLEGTGAAGISPKISCVTNLMRDHLNAYPGMEEYAEAKAQIFRHQSPTDVTIFNADDAYGKEWMDEAPGLVRVFSKKKSRTSAWISNGALWMMDGSKEVKVVETKHLKVQGEHLFANMLAAMLTAKAAGASTTGIRVALKSFRGLADRQEFLREVNGVGFVNDTTATTPDGAIAAMKTLSVRFKTLRMIIGGADKELEFDGLATTAKRFHVDLVVLPGTAHEKLTKSLKKAKVSYQDVTSLEEGLLELQKRSKKGDGIVLSPGCASFGLFANEFERGARFKELVANLDQKRKSM